MPATKLPTKLNGPRRLRRSRLMLLLSMCLWCQSDACGRTNSWTSWKRYNLQLKPHSQPDGHCIKTFNRGFPLSLIQFALHLCLAMTTMRRAQAAVPAAANIKDICSSTSPLLTFYLIVALYVNQITTSHATRFSCSACDIIANAKQLRIRRKRYVSLRFHVIVPQKHRQCEQLLRIMISISLVLSASENNVSISWEFFKFASQLDAPLSACVRVQYFKRKWCTYQLLR